MGDGFVMPPPHQGNLAHRQALAELEQMGFIKQEGRKIEILKRDSLIALQDQLNS